MQVGFYLLPWQRNESYVCLKSLVGNKSTIYFLTSAVGNIAHDWINQNWYFVDVHKNRIILCNSDGKKCAKIMDFGNLTPQTLVLEPNLGYSLQYYHCSWPCCYYHLVFSSSSPELLSQFQLNLKNLWWMGSKSVQTALFTSACNSEIVKIYKQSLKIPFSKGDSELIM